MSNKKKPYLPVVIEHDYVHSTPIGRVESADDGRIVISFNKQSWIREADLMAINRISPIYNVIEKDESGRITKAELLGFSADTEDYNA